MRDLLRSERRVMERHARLGGVRLVIDPYIYPESMTPAGRRSRLELLIEFLESMQALRRQMPDPPELAMLPSVEPIMPKLPVT